MRKLVIIILVALTALVGLLNFLDIIDFGILYLFSRLWFLIPTWFGIKLVVEEERSKKISGFVLLVFAGFMFVLNIIELVFDTQDLIYYIGVVGTLVFWPVVIIIFMISVIVSLFDKGEEVHKCLLRSKTVECPPQELKDTSLKATLGKLTFIMGPETVTHRAVRLDVLAMFGKVEIVIPKDVGILAEVKTRFGSTKVIDQHSQKLIGREVIRSDIGQIENPRLLLVTSSWFGNVTVRCE